MQRLVTPNQAKICNIFRVSIWPPFSDLSCTQIYVSTVNREVAPIVEPSFRKSLPTGFILQMFPCI
jgi:hypothetical protein